MRRVAAGSVVVEMKSPLVVVALGAACACLGADHTDPGAPPPWQEVYVGITSAVVNGELRLALDSLIVYDGGAPIPVRVHAPWSWDGRLELEAIRLDKWGHSCDPVQLPPPKQAAAAGPTPAVLVNECIDASMDDCCGPFVPPTPPSPCANLGWVCVDVSTSPPGTGGATIISCNHCCHNSPPAGNCPPSPCATPVD